MMKKIFALVFILVLGKMSYSQGYPISQNLGSDSTIVISKGALQSRLAPIVISDTTAANNQRIKNYPGAQLYTANGDFYVRNATATKWVLVSSGSSGPINIYNSDGTLTGNRVLTGAGNSILFNGVSGFGVNKAPDSSFTVEGGLHATGGLRLDNLASSPGTKALRINGQGVVSVADTSVVTGTVTSVGSGYGLSGGPITTSGTLLVDSAALSNYYLRRKDSLTATNSLGYVTKKVLADTASALRSSMTAGTVTSVALTMPAAFNVAGSPVTSSGTLAVTAAGLSTQYIRGDGQLANFPGGGGGGGSSVVYYFNGGTNQGTFVGNTYYEMSKTAIVGTAANFTINADGYITQFITDAGDPALLNIPAGNWNFEMYFSASSGGGSPSFYVELYKYDGTTFTLISSSSSSPEGITGGTATDLYLTALAVPATSLTLTDRLAVRVYVTHSGRTITLHTQDNTLCQVTTTFTTGITALNGLTEQVQYFATGTSGTDFAISSASATHTFNLPTASATNRGALSSSDWTTFNSKISPSDTASMLAPYLRKADTTAMLANYVNNVGYGLSKAGQVVSADSSTLANYFLRRKDSLTSTNLLGYVTRTILADTAAAIRSADAGGTVTSIATNNGTGITGGTITTTGTLAIDTLLISTRAWRQKGVDSVAALVNSNVSGTTNRVSKFTGANTIGNSSIADSSSSVAMTILSNGNIGINTTAPNERLEIVGTSRFTRTTSPSVYLNISMENGFAEYDARGSIDHVWENGGVENMRLALGGNLGIGTASPDSMLTVLQGARFQRGVRMSGLPSAPGTRALRIDANGTLSVADTTTGGGGIGGSGTTNYLPKFTASTTLGDSRFFDNGTVTFLGNGDVNATPSTGIFSGTGGTGTNIAGAELRIRGGASTGNAAGGIISFYTSAGGSSGTGVNAGVERMRIDATGATLNSQINIANATTNVGLLLDRGSATSSNAIIWKTSGTNDWFLGSSPLGTSTSDLFLYSYGTSSTVMQIARATGNIGFNTATPGSRLQINGNAAIGYSASTAAPTNGLLVAGNTGIGTTSPSSYSNLTTLTINGTNGSVIDLKTGNTLYGELYSLANEFRIDAVGASSVLKFLTNSVTRMTLDASGNLGLGVTPSAWNGAYKALQINSRAAISGDASQTVLSNNWFTNTSGNSTYIATAQATAYSQVSGEHRWFNAPSGTAGTTITFTQAMTLDASGNLGIGTTTIGSRLQVNGNAAIGYSASTAAPTNGLQVAGSITGASNSNTFGTSSAGGYPIIINTGSGSNSIKINGRNNAPSDESGIEFFRFDGVTRVAFIQAASTFFAFATSSEAMRINSSNFLGIGTTTIGSRLQVNGGAAIGYSASTAAPTNGLAVAGNISIGQSSNAYALDALNTGASTARISITGTTNFAVLQAVNTGGTFYLGIDDSGGSNFTGTSYGRLLYSTGAYPLALFTNGVARMTLTSGGQVTLATGANVSAIAQTGYSLTGSNAQSLIDLAGTWNTTGNPTAIKLNITNTASGATANLMDLQVGGVSQFSVTKSGAGTFKDMLSVSPQTANTGAIKVDGHSLTGSNSQSLLSMTGTWNTTGNPTAISLNITNTASGASAYLMDLQVGGTTQFRVTKDGAIRTTAPTGGTADNWKFGTKVASSVVLDDNDYLEVEVGGTLYRVALVNLAEPEPDPEPLTTPDDRIFREPVRVKAISQSDNQKIKDLEKELAELKEMIKSIKK